MDVIFQRRSVREYTDKPVSDDMLYDLLYAGMSAPSAMDRRQWEFIIINDRDVLDYLAGKLPYAKMLKQAKAAICVCGDKSKMPEKRGEDYWVQDCSAATQNILLAAHSLGIGAVWTAVYPSAERVEIVRDKLKIPENVIPLNIIPLGYPADNKEPKDKRDKSKVHYNTW